MGGVGRTYFVIKFFIMKQKIFFVGLLATAVVSAVFSSPKWGISFLAWVYPISLLMVFRLTTIRWKVLWAFPALLLGHFLSDYKVAPFPVPVLLLFALCH